MRRDEAIVVELSFLLYVARYLELLLAQQSRQQRGLPRDVVQEGWLSPNELAVLKELTLREKVSAHCSPNGQEGEHAACICRVFTPTSEPVPPTQRCTSVYTHYWLRFYYSGLYADQSTHVNVTAMRLMQRFLSSSSCATLNALCDACDCSMADALLHECLHLASSMAKHGDAGPVTDLLRCVFEGLEYDVLEVTPLDYFDVLSGHIPYLSTMCQQASLLLMTHEQLLRSSSSLIALFSILFAIKNIGGCDDVVQHFISSWSTDRQSLFCDLNDFLNTFAKTA